MRSRRSDAARAVGLALVLLVSGCALTPPPAASPRVWRWYAERNYCRGLALQRAGYGVVLGSLGLAGASGVGWGLTPTSGVSGVAFIVSAATAGVSALFVGPALAGAGERIRGDSNVSGSPCDFGPGNRLEDVTEPPMAARPRGPE